MRRAYVASGAAIVAAVVAAVTYASVNDPPPERTGDPRVTGWRGGVRLGASVDVPGHARATHYRVPTAPETLHVVVRAALDAPNCSPEAAADLPCPTSEEARLVFGVTALVDGRSLTLPTPELVLTGTTGNAEVAADIAAPVLSPGRHCVVVAVIERAAAVVAGQLPHHANVAVFDIDVAGSNVDHCDLPVTAGEALPSAMRALACGIPVISARADSIEVQRSARAGTFTAVVPVCDRTLVFWARDGRLLGADDHPPAVRIPETTSVGVRRSQRLDAGEWVLAVIHRGNGRSTTGTSQPVVVLR